MVLYCTSFNWVPARTLRWWLLNCLIYKNWQSWHPLRLFPVFVTPWQKSSVACRSSREEFRLFFPSLTCVDVGINQTNIIHRVSALASTVTSPPTPRLGHHPLLCPLRSIYAQGTIMRGFTPFFILLAAFVGIISGHMVHVNQHQHHER